MSPPIEPAQWIAAVATEGDRHAFAQLFGHYAPRIKAYMLRGTPDQNQAEELTQEVMLRMWRNAHRYDPARATVSTWLFTIARNVRVDALRKFGRPEPDPEDETWVPTSYEGADQVAESKRRAERVRDALAELPPEQQEILERAYYDHLSLREVAEAAHLPLGTVKSRVRLAFKRLRGVLGEEAAS